MAQPQPAPFVSCGMTQPSLGFSGALFLRGLGGFAGILALLTAITAATGHRFQFAARGNRSPGVPLPSTWTHAIALVALGAALWLLGGYWDRASFVALRRRKPWLVPTLIGFVVVPATVVVLFMLMR